jgi:hypothetical protein
MVKELMQLMQVAVEAESPPVKPVEPDTTVVDAIANANFKTVGEAAKRQMFEHQVEQQKRQNQNQNQDILQFLDAMRQASQRRKEQEKKEDAPSPTTTQEEEPPDQVNAEERLTKVKRKIQYD